MTAPGCGKKCKQLKKKTLLAQITFGDIILTLADIASDLNNAITLLLDGEMTFGLTSLLLIWAPGLLMIVWMAFRCCFAKTITWKQFLWISILCGPLFPFWVIGSYIRAIWYRNNPDMFQTQYAFSVFFKALEGFAEAAPQLLLNVYILLQRWKFCWDQIISMSFSVISLTKTASENHFIELRALKPGLKKIVSVSPFFMFHIIYRVTIIGTLTVYLKDFIVPIIVAVVSTNILGSRKLLQTHSICTFWTALSSPFSCSAFKHIENGMSEGPGIMELPETLDFYLWNTVSTVSITAITLVGLGLLLKSGVLTLENLRVTKSPIFSCGVRNASSETIQNSTIASNSTRLVSFVRECGEGEGSHDLLVYYVVPVLVGAGILSVALVFAAWFIARKDARWVHAKMKTRATGEVVSVTVKVSDRPSWLAAGPAWRQGWCPDKEEKGRGRMGWKQAIIQTVTSPVLKLAGQTTFNNDVEQTDEELVGQTTFNNDVEQTDEELVGQTTFNNEVEKTDEELVGQTTFNNEVKQTDEELGIGNDSKTYNIETAVVTRFDALP